MFHRNIALSLVLGLSLSCLPAFAVDPWPSLTIPNSAGIAAFYNTSANNPAYTSTTFNQLSTMNNKIVRFVPEWADIERIQGKYTFTNVDWLTNQFKTRGMRVILGLGLNNSLYGVTARINTQDQRDAFGRYVQAMVNHYKGQHIIWEVWNEPNIPSFWKLKPGETLTVQDAVAEYLALLDAVVPIIRATDPNALIIAPGAANYNTVWLQQALAQGLLDRVDALSVHPYQGTDRPEMMIFQHNQVLTWIPASAKGKPILFTEWGYSTGAGDTEVTEAVQAMYAPRQYLLSILLGIQANCIFSLTDASLASPCATPSACYGIFTKSIGKPKLAYTALQQLTSQLLGFTFTRRVVGALPTIYIMEFRMGSKTKYAFWDSTAGEKLDITLPNGKTGTATNTVQVL